MEKYDSVKVIARWILFREGLTRVFDCLEEENIDFLILKGWAFMGDLYVDPSQRFISDVDILVNPQDLARVVSILHELSFTCFLGSQFIAGLNSRDPCQAPLELSFHNSQGVNIDLHTHIMPSDWTLPAFKIDMHAIWQGAQPFTDWTGRTLHRLGYEHTILHLCTHIMRHDLGTQSPQSFRDLDRWVRKYQSKINWIKIKELCVNWGLINCLCYTISCSNELLESPFPQALLKSLPTSSIRQKIIRKLIPLSSVRTTHKIPWWRVILAKLLLIDHPINILKQVINSIFPSPQFHQSIYGASVTLLYHWQKILQKISL